jgi:hypothetical protein
MEDAVPSDVSASFIASGNDEDLNDPNVFLTRLSVLFIGMR